MGFSVTHRRVRRRKSRVVYLRGLRCQEIHGKLRAGLGCAQCGVFMDRLTQYRGGNISLWVVAFDTVARYSTYLAADDGQYLGCGCKTLERKKVFNVDLTSSIVKSDGPRIRDGSILCATFPLGRYPYYGRVHE